MIENLNSWIQALIVAIAITTIIEMLLPDGNNKKYIKIVCSVYILFTIVSPILSITKYDFSDLEKSYSNSIQTSSSSTKDISSIYINAYEEEIKQNLSKDGFNIRQVKLNLDNNLENISNIEIDTYYISEVEKSNLEEKLKTEYEIENIIIR